MTRPPSTKYTMSTKHAPCRDPKPYAMTSIFPDPDAPPSIVRAYLARILIERHEVDESEAHALVTSWKYGLGEELHNPQKALFIKDFGKDLGPRLYKAVDKDNEKRIREERAQWRRSRGFKFSIGKLKHADSASISLQECCRR